MYLLANLRRHELAIILGLSLGILTIAYPHQSFGATTDLATIACSSAVAEARLRQRESALLGPEHAEEHAQMRARQCRVAQGLEKVATPNVQALAVAAAAQPNIVGGQWSDPFVIPVWGITSVLLNNGKVLFWSYSNSPANAGVAYVWDPATRTPGNPNGMGHSITPPKPPLNDANNNINNIWCGGQTILRDGRVFVAGGNLKSPDPIAGTGFEGLFSTYTFNPIAETWTFQRNMEHGRWYPTTTQMADNRVVITSGYDENGSYVINPAVELFTPAAAIDGVGTVNHVSDHDPVGLYPFQYLMPSGQILQAGPYYNNVSLLTPGGTWPWSNDGFIPHMHSNHGSQGNGIIYTDASVTPIKQVIMIAGGITTSAPGGTAISNNEWLDSTNPSAGWNQYPQWLQARHNANTVILPDGTLFTVGGNSAITLYDDPLMGPATIASERYNKPANDLTGSWVQMAPNTIEAAYHSSAILLPDATVLLSQDDKDLGSPHQAQVYSPPYLFAGSRPQITRAPSTVRLGQTYSIRANVPKIGSVVLVAPGAVTHGNDMHQRFIKLQSQTSGLNLQVTIPAYSSLVPPGYYMLFIVDSNGIPSVAKFVRVS
jgi:hypothetical protein